MTGPATTGPAATATPAPDATPDPGSDPTFQLGEQVFAQPCAADADSFCGWLHRTLDNQQAAQVIDYAVGLPLFVAAVVAAALVARWLAHRAIRRAVQRVVESPRRRGRLDFLDTLDPLQTERRAQRAQAIGSLLTAAVSVLVWILAAFLVLPELGVQIAGLVAGAGIVGLALAFGAQTLVSDLVSGIFMIAEDQYGVGDVIDMGEASGVVEAVGLRTTRLRAVDGTVWHVRNGEVTRVGNMSQGWSRALLDVEVAYHEDVTRVMDVLGGIGHGLRQDPDLGPVILEEPELWGVEAFGANSVVIRMIVKTRPLEQWKIAREMRRRIKDEFDRLGIQVPFPQPPVWVRTEGPGGDHGPDDDASPGRGEEAPAAPSAAPPRGEADAATEAVPVALEDRLRRDNPLA